MNTTDTPQIAVVFNAKQSALVRLAIKYRIDEYEQSAAKHDDSLFAIDCRDAAKELRSALRDWPTD